MKKALTLVILGILFSVIMVGAPASAQTRTTFGVGFSFVPSVMVADSGDTIELNNVLAGTITPHSWTTGSAERDKICKGLNPITNQPIPVRCDLHVFGNGSGTTPLWTSIAPGAYRFYCFYHESLGMEGTIFIDTP